MWIASPLKQKSNLIFWRYKSTLLWSFIEVYSNIYGNWMYFNTKTCYYFLIIKGGPGGSMSYVVGLPNNSYKPITYTAWVRARLCKLQKGCTRLAAASDTVYQLLAHGRWFSLGIPASSTTKTDRHDIHVTEILLKVALNTINQIKSNNKKKIMT